MPEITIPFPFGDLPIKPELTGRVRVSDDMTQTLATLLGWDGSVRRLIRTSESGAAHAVSPQFGGMTHKTSTGPNEQITFSNIPTTEVMVRGHPDNGELIWVNVGTVPSTANAWPLAANDYVVLSIDNLVKLKILIVTSGNAAIVLYTR